VRADKLKYFSVFYKFYETGNESSHYYFDLFTDLLTGYIFEQAA